jgi:hypothetical protein
VGAGVEGAELAHRVAIADDQFGHLAAVVGVLPDVLGRRADGAELEEAVVPPDRGPTFDDAVRPTVVPAPMRTCGPITA